MALLYPVASAVISRGFGSSPYSYDGPYYADGTKAHEPQSGAFSRYYPHYHPALDLYAPVGTPVVAPEAGTVVDAKWGSAGTWANGGGWFVRVIVNSGFQYLIAHCSKLLVSPGQKVARGQRLALSGCTGLCSGPHVHFWVRLGPNTPYYASNAYFYNPRLFLPGGALANDARIRPAGSGSLPAPTTAKIVQFNTGVDGVNIRSAPNLSSTSLRYRAESYPVSGIFRLSDWLRMSGLTSGFTYQAMVTGSDGYLWWKLTGFNQTLYVRREFMHFR